MTHLVFSGPAGAGACECVATPDGRYVVPIWGGPIRTSWGELPRLPHGTGTQDLRDPRLAPMGRRFVGQGQLDDRAWEYYNGVWADRGLAYGPQACIYDENGALHVIHGAPPSGFRYVDDDGSLVSCQPDTYVDAARYIYEWTSCGEYTFGQGGPGLYGEDPVIAILPDGTYRLVSPGTCRRINVTRVGDIFALAWSRQDQHASEVVWLTRTELAALPMYDPLADIPNDPDPEDHVDPWIVTVEGYTPTIARGTRAIFRAAIGNGIEVEWQKEADDTVHLAVFRDGVLQDRSGKARRVEVKE